MADIPRVFISSTAEDLRQHRKAVEEAVLRSGCHPVGMERFGAVATSPVDVCRDTVRSTDALIVIVAHRYGWVPSPEQGGDGAKSITWHEVETALENGLPVLAYLVEPSHPWPELKEQDLLERAETEQEMIAVGKKVKSLKAFRQFLDAEAGLTRDQFTTPDDLAKRVTADLKNVDFSAAEPAGATSRPSVSFGFHDYHPLQPATHFRGREDVLHELQEWWDDPAHPDRVKSLVAIGGTGKTAIASEFLRRNRREKTLQGHVFVWSFYEDPNTDNFLAEACYVFLGETEKQSEPGGRLVRLERALRDGAPHVLVLDGLERIQADQQSRRSFGELDDHQLKNLLRLVAADALGNTRALVTTRFPLADLKSWDNAGHRTVKLQNLEEPAAVALLSEWGVQGDDDVLAELADRLGHHALSVSVLGSYLAEFCDGDPSKAPDFAVDEAATADPQAAKLGRILAEYARSLPAPERDLLVRLSVFPRGVSVQVLGYLVNAGGEIAGHLVNADQERLVRLAKSLERQGLVFSYGKGQELRFTAHPFLRDHFRALVGVAESEIYETIRSAYAPSLESNPSTKPTDKEVLDRYEELIEYTIGAGDVSRAFRLYWFAMGHYEHLAKVLGDYARCRRIHGLFATSDDPCRFHEDLDPQQRGLAAADSMLVAMALGDLDTATELGSVAIQLAHAGNHLGNKSRSLANQAELSITRGHLVVALTLSSDAASLALDGVDDTTCDDTHRWEALSWRAYSNHLAGRVEDAVADFRHAAQFVESGSNCDLAVYQQLCMTDLDRADEVIDDCNRVLEFCFSGDFRQSAARCRYALGMAYLHTRVATSVTISSELRSWSTESGSVESLIESHHLASEIARIQGDVESAVHEAELGLTHARNHGFGLLLIQLLISLAKAHLAAPDDRAALAAAREALDLSRAEECQYAWGEADAAHACGVAHARLGQVEQARKRFTEALAVRERIGHPRPDETRAQLAKLP